MDFLYHDSSFPVTSISPTACLHLPVIHPGTVWKQTWNKYLLSVIHCNDLQDKIRCAFLAVGFSESSFSSEIMHDSAQNRIRNQQSETVIKPRI